MEELKQNIFFWVKPKGEQVMVNKTMNTQDLAEQITRDGITITTASKTTMWGYFSSVLGFLADNGVAVVIGTLVAVGGFLVNLYFQRRRNKREKEIKDANERREQERHEWLRAEHHLKIELLKKGVYQMPQNQIRE